MYRIPGFYGRGAAASKLGLPVGFCLLLAGVSSYAQGVSPARVAAVDALFQEWDRSDSPGCALGVIEDAQLVLERSYGMANLEHGVALSSRSVFRTGSLGKQFTAFAVLVAEQQGKLSVKDDVREYLPELPVTETPITIEHLIHHTSGLRDYLTLMSLAGLRDEDFYTEQDILDRLSRQEHLNFPPGSEYLYSNTGYFLLSQILPRATGMSLAEFSERYLFAPLGMKNTHFHDDFRRIVEGRAQGYRPRASGEGFEIDQTTLNMVGDGGVFTTIEDLLDWDRNFYTGEVGGSELAARRLVTGRLSDGTEQTYAYGLGIGSHAGRRTVSHGGAFVGFRSAMIQFPDDRLSVYVLCNLSSISPMSLAEKVADVLLDVEAETEPEAAPSAGLEPLAGIYFDDSTGGVVTVNLQDGVLHWAERDADLRPVAGESSLFALGEARFRFSSGGLEVTSPGQRPFHYARVEAVEPDVKALVQYVGLYRCRELDVTYRLELDPDSTTLVLDTGAERFALTPLFWDGFRWELGSVVFSRNREGRLRSFELAAGRARDFIFERL